ncbi:hypothetical protein LWI28_022537 [Acer negundo]|uniref:SCP domain-containing protein n=1 Tax=Acer negundo TaxID=4023 RepID=A0AAD5IWN5_ACENE|nr:hypothetical protein LWI28_022537 [Acer negundo]
MASAENQSRISSENQPEGDASTMKDNNKIVEKIKSGSQNSSKGFNPSGHPLGSYCSVKLNHDNYLLWKNMVLPVIRGNRMEEFITGAKQCPHEFIEVTGEESIKTELEDNPDYEEWIVQDQILLGWIYNSIDIDVASELMGYETSKQLWDAIRDLFGVKNRSNVVLYKREFNHLKKGNIKMGEYLKAIKKLVDNLALAEHHVTLDDLVSQVLTGLDSLEYNPVVCQINEKENITRLKLQSKLLSYEKRLEQLNDGITSINLGQPIANFANTKGGSNHANYNKYQSHSQQQDQLSGINTSLSGGRFSGSNNRGGRSQRSRGGRYNGNQPPICQVCGKICHTTAYCYYRFDNSYMGAPPEPNKINQQNQHSAFVATPETLSDPAWYADSGASSHVTNDVGNLNQKKEYNGKESLVVGNGEKLNINHVGHAYLSALNNKNLLLKDILHVPSFLNTKTPESQTIIVPPNWLLLPSASPTISSQSTSPTPSTGDTPNQLFPEASSTSNQSDSSHSLKISGSAHSTHILERVSFEGGTPVSFEIESDFEIANDNSPESSAPRVDEHQVTEIDQSHQMITRAKAVFTKPKQYPAEYQLYLAKGHGVPSEPSSMTLILPTIHTQDAPQYYLDAHNSARAKVGVGPMTWSEKLATYAENYASTRVADCTREYSGGPYGENLANGTRSSISGTDIINIWIAEKANYDSSSNVCIADRSCKNYTQVVWQKSLSLGCAKVRCSEGGYFFSCNYDPKGNLNGQRPFEINESSAPTPNSNYLPPFISPSPAAKPPNFDFVPPSNYSEDSRNVIGLLMGLIAGASALIILGLVFVWFFLRWKRKQKESYPVFDVSFGAEFENGTGPRKLVDVVDKKLGMNFDIKQMECLMIVGLWCAHPARNLRPSIRQAIQGLNFELSLPNLPSKMPVPNYDVPSSSAPAPTAMSGESWISLTVPR